MRRTFNEFKSEVITRSDRIKQKKQKLIRAAYVAVPSFVCAVLAVTFIVNDSFAEKSDALFSSEQKETYSYMQNDIEDNDEIINEIADDTVDKTDSDSKVTAVSDKTDTADGGENRYESANSASGVPLKTTIQICKTEGETVSYKNVTAMNEVYNIMKILNGETAEDTDKQNLEDVEIRISVTYLDNTENIYAYINSDGVMDQNGTFLLTAEQASAILKLFEENK